jgi:hypothetical protein
LIDDRLPAENPYSYIRKQLRSFAVRPHLALAVLMLVLLPSAAACAAEWQLQHPTPQGNSLWKVAFADERCGFAVGDTGLILRSADGGFIWSGEFAKTEHDLFGLRVLDDTVAWVAGDNRTILLTGTPHRSPTSAALDDPAMLPEEMYLEQNYPNPFNGLTHIGYSVGVASVQSPVVGLVRLVVYDLLGREVAVLMDEDKTAGSYSVRFDASGLASGVYVYRLSTSNGTLSRKMLLLR